MDALTPIITDALGIIITAIASYVALKISSLKVGDKKTETVYRLVETTVRYAEQVYKDLGGKEKFTQVKNTVLSELEGRGINVDPVRLDVIIESTVHGLKSGSEGSHAEYIKSSGDSGQ